MTTYGLIPLDSLVQVLAAASPWMIAPIVTFARVAQSRTLTEESATAAEDAPAVSIIIPARNEEHNIARCVNAALSTKYPSLEVIVVDDHSTDDTRAIVNEIARNDHRLRIVDNPALPEGWFGKQWACQNGANASSGEILIFLDADARVAPDLVTRSVNGMQRHRADLYTVIGQQELGTFWERVIQPQIFSMILSRYGGTECINRSNYKRDKIANGQYLMIRRSAYNELGGHALVRMYVAEDLMLAQKYFAVGRKTVIIMGRQQLSTRMYRSLSELINGWRKNVYAGGREAVPLGKLGRIAYPFLLVIAPLMQIVPVLAIVAALAGFASATVFAWGILCAAVLFAWWMLVYLADGTSPIYALFFPLGAAMTLYIFVTAIARGSRVSWKGRRYVSAG